MPLNWNDGSESYNKIHALRILLLALVEAVERSNDPALLNSQAFEDAQKAVQGMR